MYRLYSVKRAYITFGLIRSYVLKSLNRSAGELFFYLCFINQKNVINKLVIFYYVHIIIYQVYNLTFVLFFKLEHKRCFWIVSAPRAKTSSSIDKTACPSSNCDFFLRQSQIFFDELWAYLGSLGQKNYCSCPLLSYYKHRLRWRSCLISNKNDSGIWRLWTGNDGIFRGVNGLSKMLSIERKGDWSKCLFTDQLK